MRYTNADIAPMVRAVRRMDRYFRQIAEEFPLLRAHLPALQWRYMEALNEELAPHALDLARALAEVEERVAEHRRKHLHWRRRLRRTTEG